MSFETIEFSQQGPVGILTLNRPDKLNSITKTMLDELNAVLDDVETNDSILTLVLNGNGRAFCAGFDLLAGSEAKRDRVSPTGDLQLGMTSM